MKLDFFVNAIGGNGLDQAANAAGNPVLPCIPPISALFARSKWKPLRMRQPPWGTMEIFLIFMVLYGFTFPFCGSPQMSGC